MKINIFILFCFVSFTNCLAIKTAMAIETNSNTAAFNPNYTNLLKGFALGAPTNGISIGAKFLNSSQSNIFVCLFTTGQTDPHQFWIAPPQFQRMEYYLYDSSGKVIPYLETYHPANKIYKSISKVPKNVHNVHEGTMWPPFTMPYDQIALTNVFQIERGGDYKLVAKARIMKINGDGSLSVIEFPPVSLPIHWDQSPK